MWEPAGSSTDDLAQRAFGLRALCPRGRKKQRLPRSRSREPTCQKATLAGPWTMSACPSKADIQQPSSPTDPGGRFARRFARRPHEKGNVRTEAAEATGSTGAASGLFRSRFLSQSRIATRSSRNAALTNASKNSLAMLRVEPRPSPASWPRPDRVPCIRALPLKSGSGKRKPETEKRKYAEGRCAVPHKVAPSKRTLFPFAEGDVPRFRSVPIIPLVLACFHAVLPCGIELAIAAQSAQRRLSPPRSWQYSVTESS